MRKLVVANYKMNGDKNFFSQVRKNFKSIKVKDTDIVLCPPFVYVPFLKIKNKNVSIGVQDLTNEISKKCTGQISPSMLHEFGVKYAIVGHSERRAIGETDLLIANKVEQATNNGIIPIVCVGEELKNSSLDVINDQVKIALSKAKGEVVFAYEPLWAIGSGEIPAVKQIQKVIKQIKLCAKKIGFDIKVLYGGSVNESNCKELLNSNADGFLLGGVTLNISKFLQLIRSVDE